MSSGFLTPWARLRELSDLGLVLAGAKLHTYVAGTPSTPLATYSDQALTIPNANPIVASAGGLFGPIYLTPAVAYKFVLTDASDVTVPGYPQDNVKASGFNAASLTNHGVVLGTGTDALAATSAGTAGQVLTSNGAAADPTFQAVSGVNPAICQGRLTLTTGVPVTTADVLAATTLRFAPYNGNLLALYSGTAWALFTFPELSIAVPATTSQLYDVFVYDNAGTRTLELLAWTNDTTRATALVTQDGVLCKTGALTRRYVGSFRTTTVSGQTEDSALKRYVWNYANRLPRLLQRFESTATWNYTTATVRQANGSAANQVDLVVGIAESPLHLELVSVNVDNPANQVDVSVGIGEDSTTTYAAGAFVQTIGNARNGLLTTTLVKYPAIGRHVYSWNEWSTATGTTAWRGAYASAGATITSGLTGWIDG